MTTTRTPFIKKSLVRSLGLVLCALGAGSALAQTGGLPTQVGGGVSRVGSGVAANPQQQNANQQVVVPPQGNQGSPAQAAPAQRPRAVPPAPLPMNPLPSPALGSSLINEALDNTNPLTPDEVRTLRRELEVRKSALTENISGRAPPRPTTSIFNLDLSPGVTPPVVRVEVGQGSIISFLDAGGRPWPARVADNFSPNVLTLSQFTEHQLSIGTTSGIPINAGVAVALEGIPVAITFSVISGQPVVDTQVHMVVPQYKNGPPPGVGVLRGEPSLTAGDLMSYLLRTPPASARKLTVEGLPGALAWQVSGSRMVLRSKEMVASGAFRVQGIGDGTFVYELPLSPQVRVVQGDRFNSIRISGFTPGE